MKKTYLLRLNLPSFRIHKNSIPELNKVNTEGKIPGHPYKGDVHPDAKKHIFHVINYLKYTRFEPKLSVAWLQQEICKAAFESVERGSL